MVYQLDGAAVISSNTQRAGAASLLNPPNNCCASELQKADDQAVWFDYLRLKEEEITATLARTSVDRNRATR